MKMLLISIIGNVFTQFYYRVLLIIEEFLLIFMWAEFMMPRYSIILAFSKKGRMVNCFPICPNNLEVFKFLYFFWDLSITSLAHETLYSTW